MLLLEEFDEVLVGKHRH
jgi:hypothetical protein